jgi:hypothetical protein
MMHVNAQIQRANIAWAQAAITVRLLEVLIEQAPNDAAGHNIIADQKTNLFDDAQVIYNAYAAQMSYDILEVFFTATIEHPLVQLPYAGYAFPPAQMQVVHGETSFVILSPGYDIRLRVLAHKIGHCLSNQEDVPAADHIFYPREGPAPLDNVVNARRRITSETETACRTDRLAGNPNGVGNSLLVRP